MSNKSMENQRVMDLVSTEMVELRTQLQEARHERDMFKDDFEKTKERLNDALRELRCPECGCADAVDAQSQECGCDSPLCERTIDDGTLAESWLKMHAALAAQPTKEPTNGK